MHSAPAVSFPVGRSHFQAWVIGLAALAGCVTGLLWLTQVDRAGWRQGLFALSYLVSCTLAIAMWLRSPQGVLRWDGQAWSWKGKPANLSRGLTAHLDLQHVLLVCLAPDNGPRLWLWAERRMSKLRWNELRRAVFAKHVSIQDINPEAPMKHSVP